MAAQIQLRNDTSANWESENPILAQGEVGIETDTRLVKLGDGVNNWNDLGYGLFGMPDSIDGGTA
jgi:hypothetical protein